MTTGIFYGSTTGNTEALAKQIGARLDLSAADIRDVSNAEVWQTQAYELLLFGSSTWGLGELQDDWQGFIGQLAKTDLSGKRVGLFGCGDSASYPDTFCDSIAIIRDEMKATGCTFVGEMDASGYPSAESRAFEDGMVLGLAADDDDPSLTALRLDAWLTAINGR